jgi:ABC-type amino acid transport substrate-binding protein
MNKKMSLCVLLSVLAIITIVPAVCRASEPLIIGSAGNLEPFVFEQDGIIQGFSIDLFKEVAKRAGFQVEHKLYPPKRLIRYLQEGKIDGTTGIYYRKERDSYLMYTSAPMIISRTRVFVKKGREFPLQSIKDLFGKQIGIIAGWTIDNAEYNQATDEGKLMLQEVAHYDQNLKKLQSGRIDCAIMTEQLTWYYANKLGFGEDILALDMIFAEVHMYFAMSKKSPKIADPQSFMEKLNAALNEVLADGTYEELQEEYGVTTLQ